MFTIKIFKIMITVETGNSGRIQWKNSHMLTRASIVIFTNGCDGNYNVHD